MINPAEECPHFDFCNQNDCPIDRNFPILKSFPEDKGFKTCKLTKRKRLAIALKHSLGNRGLFNRESPQSKFCKAIIEEFEAERAKPQENKDKSEFIGEKTPESATARDSRGAE